MLMTDEFFHHARYDDFYGPCSLYSTAYLGMITYLFTDKEMEKAKNSEGVGGAIAKRQTG